MKMNSDEDYFESADELEEDAFSTVPSDGTPSTNAVANDSIKKGASGEATSMRESAPEEARIELNTTIPEVLVTRSSEAEFDENALVDAATVVAATVDAATALVNAASSADAEGDIGDDESCVTTDSTVTVVAAADVAFQEPVLSLAPLATPKTTPPTTPPTPSPVVTPPNTPAIAPKSGSGWGSWKSWGAELIASASQSVAKMSTEIGQGLGEMQNMGSLDEREEGKAGLEAADGAENDGHDGVEKEKPVANDGSEEGEEKSVDDGSFFSFFSTAGKGIVDSGLNVLETVGKKTMQVINETDPGLNKTKSLLVEGKEKVNLSQMLRDAKKAREEKEKEEILEKQKVAFEYWFEEKQGLVSLEALEILSGESEEELESLFEDNADLKLDLLAIRDAFLEKDESEKRILHDSASTGEAREDPGTLESNVDRLGIGINLAKLEEARRTADSLLAGLDSSSEVEEDPSKSNKGEEESRITKIESPSTTFTSEADDASLSCHQNAMVAMGYFVAECVKFFHKTNQMFLMTPPSIADDGDKLSMDDVNEKIEALYRIKSIMVAEVVKISARFDEKRAKMEQEAGVLDPVSSSLSHEVSRGTSLIQEAYRLSIPIMQKCYYDQSLIAALDITA